MYFIISVNYAPCVFSASKVQRATVTFDYTAEADDELSLTKGDIIEITSQDVSEGWWEGKAHGKTGVFPNNFVELLPDEVRFCLFMYVGFVMPLHLVV